MLEKLFTPEQFVRILVHFDIPDDVLQKRVLNSQRNTNIFRGAFTNFEEVLVRQQTESLRGDVVDPIEGETDHLFVIKDNEDVNSVIQRIAYISERY